MRKVICGMMLCNVSNLNWSIGSVGQWLGCRSLDGILSLICDYFVGRVSAMDQPTRPTQPSITPGW